MSEQSTQPPVPNPVTRRQFRRGVWLEIYLPLIVGGLLLAGAVVGIVAAAGGGTFSAWADASLVLLILPGLLLGLILGSAFWALAVGIGLLVREAPPYFKLAQDFLERLAGQTRRASDGAVAPVLRAGAALAALKSLAGRARHTHDR